MKEPNINNLKGKKIVFTIKGNSQAYKCKGIFRSAYSEHFLINVTEQEGPKSLFLNKDNTISHREIISIIEDEDID